MAETTVNSGPPARLPTQARGTFSKKFNFKYFLQDNITGNRWLLIWVLFLAFVTFSLAWSQLETAPLRAGIIIGVWAVGLLLSMIGELFTLHFSISRWLKESVFNSVTNTLITLLSALLVGMLCAALWNWGYIDATFDPALTAPDVRSTGASWGVLWGARKLLLTGVLSPEHSWRVILTTAMIGVMWLFTYIGTRPAVQSSSPWLGRVINWLWLVAPVAAYIFLAGAEYTAPFIDLNTLLIGTAAVVALMALLWFFRVIQLGSLSATAWVLVWPIAYILWRAVAWTQIFPVIDADQWGGLLLTIIFAILVNILSFPIGIALALGRRADMQGIPKWITWPLAIAGTAYFLWTSTSVLWPTSRNWFEQLLALWPLLIPIATYYFHRSFDGNVMQAFSILSIEIIRGVPLITLLFMAIIMAPFFQAEGAEPLPKFWAVIIGYTIFSSAYMAELVRGGLQAIPRGQYEASDAVGLNTLQKYRFIVLPQALRILIPPLAGAVIGTFKSSSLVALVGLIDLVGAVPRIIANQEWLGLRSELYAFIFVLYFLVSSIVSAYSRRLEERTGLGVR